MKLIDRTLSLDQVLHFAVTKPQAPLPNPQEVPSNKLLSDDINQVKETILLSYCDQEGQVDFKKLSKALSNK
jgi:hypothetical protein